MVFTFNYKLVAVHAVLLLLAALLPIAPAMNLFYAVVLIGLAIVVQVPKPLKRAKRLRNTANIYGFLALIFVPLTVLIVRNPYGFDTIYITYTVFCTVAVYLFLGGLSHKFYFESQQAS